MGFAIASERGHAGSAEHQCHRRDWQEPEDPSLREHAPSTFVGSPGRSLHS